MGKRSGFSWVRFGVMVSLLVASSVSLVRGQGGRGGITGIVSDPSGAMVAGATVTATNLNTSFMRTTVSGNDGSFVFSLLDPGQYRIEVVAQGFKKLTREPISVRVTETTDLRTLALEVGAVTETVNVTGEAAQLQTTQATLGKVFDQRMVVDLPLVTRNFTQLLSLQAGVVAEVPSGASFGTGSNGFSVGGGRYYDNSILIDGINAELTISTRGPLGGVSVPAPDTVEEFKVQTNLFSAEFGRAGGSSVNLVTKSGSNHLHGNVYEFIRNNALNANEFFYKASQIASGNGNHAPILRQNQFGGTIGGPIRKDKTFFFASYQGTRQLNGASPGLVFSDPVYPYLPAGDRSNTAQLQAQLGAIYGGRTGLFGGGLINGTPVNYLLPDGSNINPVSLRILQSKLASGQYLLPSFPQSSLNDGAGGLNGGQIYANSSFSIPGYFDEDQYMINIDHQISSRQTFSGKFFSSGQYNDLLTGNVPGFTFVGKPQNRNLVLTHTFTFGPTLVNEFRAGYTRVTNPTVRQDPGDLTAADVGMLPAPDAFGRFPRIILAGSGLDFGADHFFTIDKENQYTLSDTVSKIAGRHSLRIGGTLVRHQLYTNSDLVKSGQLIIGNFVDFLLGLDGVDNNLGISNIFVPAAQTGSLERDFRFNDVSYFVQDDIKVRPNLTLNLGLRWDYFAWPTDTMGRMSNFDNSKIAEGLFGIPTPEQGYTGFTLAKAYADLNPDHPIPAGVALVSNTTLNGSDFNNYGPRVGFAWAPFKKTSIRGGYGIFYPRVSSDAAHEMAAGLPFNQLDLVIGAHFGSMQDPFTFMNLPPDSTFPLWPLREYVPGTTPSYFNAPFLQTSRNPYVQQWNLSLQYEIARDMLLEIAYVGSHGLRLLTTQSGNQPGIASEANPIRGVTTNTPDPTNIQARVPVAGIQADRAEAITQTTAQSKYNALLITVSKRYAHGLQFQSSFTWGKSTDTNSLISDKAGLATGSGNLSNAAVRGGNAICNCEWGLSNYDRAVRSTTNFVYALPNPMRNKGALLKKAFGGWQTAGVLTFQDGNPITLAVTPNYSAVKASSSYLTADLLPGKTLADVQGSGPTESRLNGYFKTPGLTTTGQPIAGTAFALPGPLDYGQLGRGLPIRTPGQKSIDFVVSKRTPIREHTDVEFRAEFFNLFNWVNFGGPDSAVSDTGFGLIRSTTTAPRIIQFALKLNF